MIIDIRKLSFNGKQESEFSFKYEPQGILTLPNSSFLSPLDVYGNVELHGKDVYVDGVIKGTIVGECSRCLERAEYELNVEFSERFVEFEPDEFDYLYKLGKLDLTEMVNDNILSNLPTVIYCKEDCKGLCPICGQNLNLNQCDCKK